MVLHVFAYVWIVLRIKQIIHDNAWNRAWIDTASVLAEPFLKFHKQCKPLFQRYFVLTRWRCVIVWIKPRHDHRAAANRRFVVQFRDACLFTTVVAALMLMLVTFVDFDKMRTAVQSVGPFTRTPTERHHGIVAAHQPSCAKMLVHVLAPPLFNARCISRGFAKTVAAHVHGLLCRGFYMFNVRVAVAKAVVASVFANIMYTFLMSFKGTALYKR